MKKDDELRQIIRDTLISLRKEKGLTQAEVGEAVGKSLTAVASWEQGLSLPDLSTLYKLSKFYNKSIAYMFGEEEQNDH